MAEEKPKRENIYTDSAASEAGRLAAKKALTYIAVAPAGPAGKIAAEVGSRVGAYVIKNKGKVAGAAGGLLAAPFAIGGLFLAALGAGLAALGSALVFTISATVLSVVFIFFIINNSALVVPSYIGSVVSPIDDVIIANPDCPVVDGALLGNNPMWGSYQNETVGHGSAAYWASPSVASSCFAYPLPQQTDCYGPPGNVCGSGAYSLTCPYYGFSLDVNSATNIVVLPKVGDESPTWTRIGGWEKGTGATNIYTSETGKYTIVLSHMDRITSGTNIPSGTQIGRVATTVKWTPHLHFEFQVDGVWVRPENYFCR